MVDQGQPIYLFNFSCIGGSIALGLALNVKKYKHARRVVQLLVGLYMLVYLGLLCNDPLCRGENFRPAALWPGLPTHYYVGMENGLDRPSVIMLGRSVQ